MVAFIEVPMVGFNGSDVASVWVNTADIITLTPQWEGSTKLEIRDLGSEGMSVTRVSYIPIGMYLDKLSDMSRWSGVVSWSDDTKKAFREPAQERARTAADRERSAARQGH